MRRNRAGSDSENAPNRQQRRAEAKRNAELLEEQQRQQAIAASLRDQEQAKRPEGRPPRAPTQSYGYGSSTDNLQSLGGEYGFGRGGSTGLDSLLGGTRQPAPAPPPPPPQQSRQPPLDVAGLWNAPAPAPPSNGHRPAFRLDASPVAGAGLLRLREHLVYQLFRGGRRLGRAGALGVFWFQRFWRRRPLRAGAGVVGRLCCR